VNYILEKLGAGIVGAALLLGQAAWAAPVTPDYGTFGPLTTLGGGAVTFGGGGIPTDPAVIRTFQLGNDTIRLGLIATPRYSASPAVSNDGLGTYSTIAGESAPGLSLWNFSFFAESSGDLVAAGIKLFYDFDPAANTDKSVMGVLDVSVWSTTVPSTTTFEGSENLGFGYLATSIPGFSTAPAFASFDAFAAGEYSFRLEALGGAGVAMNVNISAVPLPASLPLMFAALGGLGLIARRRRRT
jgi:hypothetical protein